MQQPDGQIKPLTDFFTKKQIDEMGGPEQQLANLRQKSQELEEKTGKPHPVFEVGEELELKGGKFVVHKIRGKRLILKSIRY